MGQAQLEAEPQSRWWFPGLSQRKKKGLGWWSWGRHGAGTGRNVFKGCSQSQREPSQQQQQNYVSPGPRETLKKGGSQRGVGSWEQGGGGEWDEVVEGHLGPVGQGWNSQGDPPADRMTSWLKRGECLLLGDRGPAA